MKEQSKWIGKKYRRGRRLAIGGMADVYEGEHVITRNRVAIKLLRDFDDAEGVERFKQEAELAMQIHHENLCEVLEYGTSHGQPFIAMPLLQGLSLSQEIEYGVLEIGRAAEIASQILGALQAVHDADVLHRDLKSSNVFLDQREKNEKVKVLDLGVSKCLDSKTTSTNVAFGTAHYMPPERIMDNLSNARGDIYAVGVILYEMLTGEKPYDGRPEDVRDKIVSAKPFVSPGRRNPRIPFELERVVVKAMSRDPDERFASAEEMREALERSLMHWTSESIERPMTMDATRDNYSQLDSPRPTPRSTVPLPGEIPVGKMKIDLKGKSLLKRIKHGIFKR